MIDNDEIFLDSKFSLGTLKIPFYWVDSPYRKLSDNVTTIDWEHKFNADRRITKECTTVQT